jgi:multiple sugar transport system ATP-binding protein
MTMGQRVAVMKDGVLQQVDAPQRLYDEPANLFVAGFIGTPPMNLLALARYSRLREFDGRQVVFGVRSEDIHPAASRPELPAIEARLELVEALGSTTMAFFRIEARSVLAAAEAEEVEVLEAESEESIAATRPNLVAAFPPRVDLRLGDAIRVAFDTSHAHFFDESTGAALR